MRSPDPVPPPLFGLSVERAVARVRERSAALGTFITTRLDEALAEARALAQEPPRSPLHGVPYGMKDEFDTAGLRTTGGSMRYQHRVPARSGPAHEVFSAAGAVLLGKTNMSDLGLAPEATSWIGGPARNPHDPARTAGGSSGGSAAAVADGMVAFEWGADIGGSIRLPAAFCGVLGLRLSSEAWPLSGFFPEVPSGLAWMCGQGPFTRTVAQMRAVLDVAAPLRQGRQRAPFRPRGAALLVPDWLGEWPSFVADVTPAVRRALDAEPELRPDLPSTTRARNVYAGVWASHFDELLAADPSLNFRSGLGAVLSAVVLRGRLGDRRIHPLTAELLLLIYLGSVTLFRSRERALRDARSVRDAFEAIWDRGLVVVAPVTCVPPPKIGRSTRYPHLLSCTVPGNLADATGLAVPFGTFPGGLPRAIQLLGPPGSERALLDLAERLPSPPGRGSG